MLAKGLTPILNISSLDETFAWIEKLGHLRQSDGRVFRVSKACD